MVQPKPKLTLKESKLVKAVINGANQTEAGLAADSNRTPESARVWANQALQKTTVQEALQIEMAKQGITLEAIVKPIADGLKADKQNEYTGEIKPDHAIRLKSSNMAAQFLGIGKNSDTAPSVHFHNHVAEQREKYGI